MRLTTCCQNQTFLSTRDDPLLIDLDPLVETLVVVAMLFCDKNMILCDSI